MARIIKGNFNDDNLEEKSKTAVSGIKLFLNEKDETIMSEVQKKNLIEELNSFLPIKDGEIDVKSIYIFDTGDSIEVKVFFRNATDKTVTFDKIPMVLYNSKNDIIARQVFNLVNIGDIPEHSARPYKLYFDKASFNRDMLSYDNLYIGFDTNVSVVEYKDFEFEGLPENISEENKFTLESFLKSLPKIEGGVDLQKFSIGLNESGEFLISVILRNGLDKPLSIEKLPVTVLDENKNKVFSAQFTVPDLKINPNKAYFLNLAYKTDVIPDNNMDLSNWELIFKA